MDHLIYSPITADMLGIEICESSIIFMVHFTAVFIVIINKYIISLGWYCKKLVK